MRLLSLRLDESQERNQTKVGLKQAVGYTERRACCERNQTKVGLKQARQQ